MTYCLMTTTHLLVSFQSPPLSSRYRSLPSPNHYMISAFCISSSSSEEEEEVNVDANTKGNQGNGVRVNPTDNPSPPEPQDDNGDADDKKSESFTSNTGSSDENIADPFSLLELQDNFAAAVSKVDSLDKVVAHINSKADQKVTSFDSKLELIIKSLFEIKDVGPFELDQPNQLDQLISL
ncbi:unnamed protein product [Lactuca saligna]|uniref:Uncharacterized protein n=1 Tax=Lactuca saligna TaxID=75948 RepID=A0AA35W093_LACSI|nr:unnamed protein product [Lactuca saligna]